MKVHRYDRAFTLLEMLVAAGLIGVVGLVLYSLLNLSTILGAKNTVINTIHEQTRVQVLDMLKDLHSAVSLPQLVNNDGITPWTSPTPAPGISFQKWAVFMALDQHGQLAPQPARAFKIYEDAQITQNYLKIAVPSNWSAPLVGQGLIVPTHQVEADIHAVQTASGAPSGFQGYRITLWNFRDRPLPNSGNLPVAISGTTSAAGDIVCFITDRYSYTITNNTLRLNFRGNSYRIGSGTASTNSNPFYIPSVLAGPASGAAFALSTFDLAYNNRGFRSGNILFTGQVPIKAKLTTYQ
jgi:prepilin-type N-terminal cleavage/methylation domain-containing protein